MFDLKRFETEQNSLSLPSTSTPPLQLKPPSTSLAGSPLSLFFCCCHTPFKCPHLRWFPCYPVWSRMSRQLSQLPTPDLPAGASPQFGSCTQPAGSLTGGNLNSLTGLKSLLQHPMKGDQRLKQLCDLKGEGIFFLVWQIEPRLRRRVVLVLHSSTPLLQKLQFYQNVYMDICIISTLFPDIPTKIIILKKVSRIIIT